MEIRNIFQLLSLGRIYTQTTHTQPHKELILKEKWATLKLSSSSSLRMLIFEYLS